MTDNNTGNNTDNGVVASLLTLLAQTNQQSAERERQQAEREAERDRRQAERDRQQAESNRQQAELIESLLHQFIV